MVLPKLSGLPIVAVVCGLAAISLSSSTANSHSRSIFHLLTWSAVQWIPSSRLRDSCLRQTWAFWERDLLAENHELATDEIPVVSVQDHLHDIVPYLESKYGTDWRERPLLLKGLWSPGQLLENQQTGRRLSKTGLMKENLTIPYFSDARKEGSLTPDAHAAVGDIVANISQGEPHKIATQLLLQAYPDVIAEVAPLSLVTHLFGPFFSENALKGSGPFGLLPALTTVPVFIAGSGRNETPSAAVEQNAATTGEDDTDEPGKTPFTALHCEPIGNVAVQLSGVKRWTIIRPEFSRSIKPCVSPDGRAFFASWSSSFSHVPRYAVDTLAGDAVWIPTWTWHRVDYDVEVHRNSSTTTDDDDDDDSMAIGASLFHFRAADFWYNNPLFAVLILPAILSEVFGFNTQ